MAQKAGVIFEHGDELRRFLRGRNRIVEAWLNQNWARLDVGMTGPVTRETVSKVLGGRPVLEPTVKALHILRDEIRANPWEWCRPPERVEDAEGIRDYAEYSWWYDLLKPSVSFSRFERMTAQPLSSDEREYLQERLSEWSSRLKGACDQFMADNELLRALRADDAPEFQYYGGRRGRVGNPGLFGRSPDEIGLAYALAQQDMPLPLIEKARLAYDRPNAPPVHDHVSEPIVPWMDLEFEGVEWTDWEDVVSRDAFRQTYTQVEHLVVYYWDGSRYQIEDVEDGQFVRAYDGEKREWIPTTPEQKDLMITRIIRKHETADELLARRDQWIANELAERQAEWAGAGMASLYAKRDFPDGIPESEAVRAFESVLANRRANQEVMQEQEDLARARSKFKRGLRRRP